ncbi:uracil-DNA glycosylase [Canibacter sp. lx-45]|uniref:uracil-DNA glycosylase n=1 Tax=Canibacter zhuwentaonis TaxID=2837491 RepID=UPI001BDD6DA5|nr:uracil-DNA glycosylase [Canibacter zhuwentaonis]MBT1035220.1 uracil-DNA glycosylase [Canibacter zhuwentaonis]
MAVKTSDLSPFVREALRKNRVDQSWYPALARVSAELEQVLRVVAHERKSGIGVLPDPQNVFRALRTPLELARVLILGQDPYPNRAHATGLAFSVDSEAASLPASLRNIYAELATDVAVRPVTGDLSGWVSQGVLLLNTVLTVREGESQSHSKIGWQPIVRRLVRALAERENAPLMAVLWGKNAAGLLPELGLANTVPVFANVPGVRVEYMGGVNCAVHALASPHPSPLSAHRGFFGSKPFSRVNELLIAAGVDAIYWG